MVIRRFKQVDVFTSRPFYGNPVAVVLDGEGIEDAEMQRIARWTNLSETTFVLPPTRPGTAEYRLRIFAPLYEMPFAGHPTIGSAHAVLESGILPPDTPSFRMECGAGILSLRVEGEGHERRIFSQAPRPRIVHEYSTSVEAISTALGAPVASDTPPLSIDNGPVWLFSRLESAEAVAVLRPDLDAVATLSRDFSIVGIAAFALTDGETAVRIRCFAPDGGTPEDPVTGSANAALPEFLRRYGLVERTGSQYVSSQGTEMGRDGRVHVRVADDGGIEIGGQSVTIVDGEIDLEGARS